ncbi:MAG: hypothetical protein CBE00_12205 [Planctomycetaceae bacterium TMED240]|nr:hypothetical protein [Rhodopirellula sp.]OUX04599.1 MAG: hypothetical protein CBE00_12205 [Planctomycetaceae bacterium TMED240]
MDNSPQPSTPQPRPDEDHPNPSLTNPVQEPSPVGNKVNENIDDVAPVMARLVDDTPDRVGSPFAAAPSGKKRHLPTPVALHDLGPLQYTAMGGVVAAAMLLGFAIMALSWFPIGGCIIAALGCVTAILGLHSKFKRITTGLLVTHGCLFIACFISANT